MVINRISIKNFKSISELVLDFSSLRGLWEITGDVGSGKTTVGEALLYALFGSVRDKNNRELIKWGEKHALIEMDCFTKGHTLHVTREINAHGSNPTDVLVDGEPLQFTNKRDAQSILEQEYYDVPRLSLELLCIITFTGFKSMSTMSSSDTKKFLDQSFSLSVITDLYDAAQNERKAVNDTLETTQREQYAVSKQISQVEKWADTDADELKAEIKSKTIMYDEAVKKMNAAAAERDKKVAEIRTRLTTLQQRIAAVKTEGARKKKEIDFLSKGICPTCGQKLDISLLDTHKAEREKLLAEYNELKGKIDTETAEITEEQNKWKPTIDEHRCSAEAAKAEKAQLTEKLRQVEQCDTEIEKLNESLEELRTEEESLNAEVSQWQELCDCLGGEMRSIILREYIPHINKNIEAYMSQLGQPYSAVMDDQFKCTITIKSKMMEVPVSMLSTGQKKVLDMVIILSVLTVLMNKINFNICFCDELLSNMDQDLRDRMCELLKSNLRPGQSMFLLCHAPLNKEYMDGTISVELQDGESVYTFE